MADEMSRSLVRGVASVGPETEVRGWQEVICGLREGWQGELQFFLIIILAHGYWKHVVVTQTSGDQVWPKCGPTGIAH